MDGFLDEEMERIREQVGDNSVFLLASGGVDSTVAAVIIARALGPERLHMLHVDNGFMRKDESAGVLELFRDMEIDENLHLVDASEQFLRNLEGVWEPEKKRRIIGDTFIDVFREKSEELGIESYLLAQGTIYPDTIETGGTRRADTIKTHHNRVPIIEEMIEQGRVVEPLADLYKVEVRELGETLGIPHRALWRHPFPGPGLGVRLLCGTGVPDTEGFELMAEGLAEVAERSGIHVTALPIRSVGVKADLRAYEHPVLLSGDASWRTLLDATSHITAEVPGINRCIWNLGPVEDLNPTPLEAYATRERLDLLREADHIMMTALERHGLYDEIWQCPTVLVPIDLYGGEDELVVVRPVQSQRAMTAKAVQLPRELLDEVTEQVLALDGVSGVAFDVTSKPPGTIEWE